MSNEMRMKAAACAVAAAMAGAMLACTPEDPSTQPLTPPESEPNQGSSPPPPGNEPRARANTTDSGSIATLNVAETAPTARAEMMPTQGSNTSGTVEITGEGDSIVFDVMLTGLEPGPHGLHVHETGNCNAPDASSAGDHYDPRNSPHGAPEDRPSARHAGDLGNVEADGSGRVHARIEDSLLRMEGDLGVVGRAIIVHATEDDLVSQPSGESGDPVACGVVRAATGEPSEASA